MAAAGACAVCHIGPNGEAYAGGRRLPTPFGPVVATNITSDPEHGIGAWSYPAFERAMRAGVHRDGHLLYPAHPYPSFAKASEADLQALYAFLLTTAPVAATPLATRLAFPFNLRPLMAGWNLLFLSPDGFRPDPTRSEAWNRGAYLVTGLGHCGACHTGRNRLGAERGGAAALAGGFVDGWEAHALTAASKAPVPWTEDAFFTYLRSGRAAHHGAAGGPMSEVVAALAPLPDADIRAMAVYLASLAPARPGGDPDGIAAAAMAASGARDARLPDSRGARLFEGACASCHAADQPLTSLALHTSLHGAAPDNVVQAILHGVAAPHAGGTEAGTEGGTAAFAAMPSFSAALDAGQVADLADYLRARFAPNQPAWEDTAATVRRLREAGGFAAP